MMMVMMILSHIGGRLVFLPPTAPFEVHENPFITCGGATKAMGVVLGLQCETFNDVRRFRKSSPCSE